MRNFLPVIFILTVCLATFNIYQLTLYMIGLDKRVRENKTRAFLLQIELNKTIKEIDIHHKNRMMLSEAQAKYWEEKLKQLNEK